MKMTKNFRASFLSIVLISLVIPTSLASAAIGPTSEGVALQRGYRTGYSDGYMSGYRDSIDGQMQSYSRHSEYTKADRAYNREYGPLEDYRDGYQQGFESGYLTGYERRSFESAMPTDLKKRAAAGQQPAPAYTNGASVYQSTAHVSNDSVAIKTDQDPKPETEPADTFNTARPQITTASVSSQFQNGPVVIIPSETELILELQDDLNTETNREGQKFTARVISPSEISGAVIEGRVAKIGKPGKVKGRSEMLLSFDRIVLNDDRWSNFNGTLIEVMAVKGDNIKSVDAEGTALGQSSTKSDAIKVGGATGAGLVVGAVVGGPVGAAVGAGVGAAFGVGAIVIERGKHIRLNRNQQVRIKTGYETQIR
ncbi:hypothetical protein BH20ACI2_BH20ACI2_17960 [soil metagenome]